MKPNPQLKIFLSPYDKSIQELTIKLRNFIIETIPSSNELIWDNYNAVAIAFSKSQKLTDAFCHLSIYSKHVNFGFNRGVELASNPNIKLKGKGKLIRHFQVQSFEDFPKKEIKIIMLEALGISKRLK